jgi:hypothetical protein
LDLLVPRKATVGSGKGAVDIRSPGDKIYDEAMDYLTKPDANTGMTPIDVYIEKQRQWAIAMEAWEQAKYKAKSKSTHQLLIPASDPTLVSLLTSR